MGIRFFFLFSTRYYGNIFFHVRKETFPALKYYESRKHCVMTDKSEYKFVFSPKEIDILSEKLEEYLTGTGMPSRDVLQLRLSIEEMLLRLLPGSEGNEGSLKFISKWGRPQLQISITGDEPEAVPGDEFEEYTRRLMENIRLKPDMFHQAGRNHIRLKLKKKESNPVTGILTALVLAVAVGLAVSLLFPGIAGLLSAIVVPLSETFLGVLATIAGPLIFLSVIWGVICIGDASTLGTIGKSLISRFVAEMFIFSAVAYVVAGFIFRPVYDAANIDLKQLSGVYTMVLNILPRNLIEPFLTNNSLQIITIAIAVGIAVLVLEQRAKTVADLVQQSNEIITFLMGEITKFIPVFVFLSLLQMFLSGSFAALADCWKIFVLSISIPFVLILGMLLFVCAKYKVGLKVLINKVLPAFMIALTTASSAAAFSTNMNCCETKLGINPRLTRFGLPLGIVIYMPGLTISFVVIAVYMAKVYGMSISAGWAIVLILSASLMAIAVPPIPGGSVTCYSILFAQLGIPLDAIAIATIVDILSDFTVTAICLVMLQMDLVIQADALGMLDKEVLRAENA